MNGTVELHEVDSAALVDNPLGDPSRRKTPVYLPAGYATSKLRYPVVYFLHGFTGAGLQWLNFPGFTRTVPERIDQLIHQGLVPPFLGVFVDGWTAIGGTQWDNSEAIGNYRDYVVRDVVGWADRTLRTIAERGARACMGKSSGGYGALVMGRDHSEVFAHLACHSGDAFFEYCYLHDFPKAAAALQKAGTAKAWFEDFWKRAAETKPRSEDFGVLNILAMAAQYSPKKGEPLNIELPFDPKTGRIREDVWARWLEKDPVRFIPKNAAAFKALQTLYVECGTKDEFNLRWGARMVVEELTRLGVAVTHEEFEDGHASTSYRYDRSLALIVPRMTAPSI